MRISVLQTISCVINRTQSEEESKNKSEEYWRKGGVGSNTGKKEILPVEKNVELITLSGVGWQGGSFPTSQNNF